MINGLDSESRLTLSLPAFERDFVLTNNQAYQHYKANIIAYVLMAEQTTTADMLAQISTTLKMLPAKTTNDDKVFLQWGHSGIGFMITQAKAGEQPFAFKNPAVGRLTSEYVMLFSDYSERLGLGLHSLKFEDHHQSTEPLLGNYIRYILNDSLEPPVSRLSWVWTI